MKWRLFNCLSGETNSFISYYRFFSCNLMHCSNSSSNNSLGRSHISSKFTHIIFHFNILHILALRCAANALHTFSLDTMTMNLSFHQSNPAFLTLQQITFAIPTITYNKVFNYFTIKAITPYPTNAIRYMLHRPIKTPKLLIMSIYKHFLSTFSKQFLSF
jgi:hypothetical protein